MKTILRSMYCVTVGAIGLVACDASPPRSTAVSGPEESKAIAAGETLVDVIRVALADVVGDEDAFSRARRLGTLLPTLTSAGLPAVKETLDDLTLDLGATELELLVRYWAIHQPEDASRWAFQKSSPLYRTAAVYSALVVWAKVDPKAAASAAEEWLEKDPSLSTVVPIALVRGWFAAEDPSELTQYIRDLGVSFYQQRAIATYVRAAIQTHGFDWVQRWAESLPEDDEPFKLAAYRQVASALPLFDHEAAIRWCDAHCDGPYGSNLRSLIARRMVAKDGASALEWLSSAPEGKDRDFAVRLTFGLWSRTDRESALEWMAAQPADALRTWLEPVLSVYGRAVAKDSPADAIAWAQRLEDDEQRENVLIVVAREWRELDPAAAEAWLLQSSLSEEARVKARRSAPQGPQ